MPIFILTALSIVTLILMGLVGFIYHITNQNYIPNRIPITRFPAEFGLDFINVEIDVQGKKMRGWFIPNPTPVRDDPGKPVVIFFHGWASNAQFLLPYAKMAHDTGFQCLVMNARGHGSSDVMDRMTFPRYCEDFRHAIDYVEKKHPHSLIALWGHSFGASAAIVVGAEHPKVRAIVTNAAFADFDHLARTMLGWAKIPLFFSFIVTTIWEKTTGVKLEDWNPHVHALRAKNHILAFHGERDRVISSRHSQWLVENAEGKVDARCIILPKINHFNFHESDRYRIEMTGFLKKHIQEPSSPNA